MLIIGTAVVPTRDNNKSKANSFTVGVLCKAPGAPVMVDTVKVQVRKAALRADMGKDSFHPGWDAVRDQGDADFYGPLDDPAEGS